MRRKVTLTRVDGNLTLKPMYVSLGDTSEALELVMRRLDPYYLKKEYYNKFKASVLEGDITTEYDIEAEVMEDGRIDDFTCSPSK